MTTLFINIKELIQVRELSEDKVYGKEERIRMWKTLRELQENEGSWVSQLVE